MRDSGNATITVNGGIVEGVTGNDITKQVYNDLASLRKELPAGMSIEIGGSLEDTRRYVETEREKWTKVIVTAKISVD